jgi:uncharacterized protein YkwD
MRGIVSGLIILFHTIFTGNSCCAQTEFRSAILQEINKLRLSGCLCGSQYMPRASPLHWNENLTKSAIKHANDMFSHAHFDHVGTDGSTLDQRAVEAGYPWWTLGENIAYGYSTVEDVVKGWEESPGHCRNMMNPLFKEMGAAKTGRYWVLDLGTRQ